MGSGRSTQRPNLVHRVASAIKQYLNQHFSLASLKFMAFCIALLSCLLAGSIMLFSLFSIALHQDLHLSYLEINFIASLSYVGMYLCLPVLGYLGDCYGPTILSLLSIWFFCPSYLFNSVLVKRIRDDLRTGTHAETVVSVPGLGFITSNYTYGFCVSFFFIGLATSSLYFASVITCAKIYPHKKGLAISFPVSCYGLSTLIGSQAMKLDYFRLPGDSLSLDLYRVFSFFGCLYFFMGVLNFLSNSIVIVEQELIFTPANTDSTENSPLLESDVAEDDSNSLLPQRSNIEPKNHHQRYREFLVDKSAWVLLGAITLNLGPLESYQVNLGSIIRYTASQVDLSNQVSLMATSSTLSRLLLGGVSDYLSSESRSYPICRVWLLVAVLVIGIGGQVGNNYISDSTSEIYSLITSLNGFAYGGLFTIYPTIVASIWGIDMMGSTWGSFMVAPAIGSVVFSMFYGKQVDYKCDPLLNGSASCLNYYFNVTSVSLLLSLVLALGAWKWFWARRGFKVF